jgi:hypothetical protein
VLEIGALAIMVSSLWRPSVVAVLGSQTERLRDQMVADLEAKLVELIPDRVPLTTLIDPNGRAEVHPN